MRKTQAALRSTFLALFVLIGTTTSGHADTQSAERFIESLGKEVITVLQATEPTNPERMEKLQKIFMRDVNGEWIARFVLGKHWRSLSDAEKERYLAAYPRFIVHTYASRFAEYSGEQLVIKSADQLNDKDTMVISEVARETGEPVDVKFRLRNSNSQYQIIDVVIEGVSQLATQRSEFNSVITRKGIDHLIKLLEKRANS